MSYKVWRIKVVYMDGREEEFSLATDPNVSDGILRFHIGITLPVELVGIPIRNIRCWRGIEELVEKEETVNERALTRDEQLLRAFHKGLY